MRLGLALVWTLICGLLLMGAAVFGIGSSIRQMKIGAWATRIWSHGVIRALGIRVTVHGKRPPRGSFTVSNHVTWLDIVVMGSACTSNQIAKHELSKLPFLGFCFRIAGTMFINRESRRDAHRLAAELRDYMAAGLTISMFPEGGCGNGVELSKFKSSLLAGAAELGTPCIPAAIHYDLAEVVWCDGSGLGDHASRMMRAKAARRGSASPAAPSGLASPGDSSDEGTKVSIWQKIFGRPIQVTLTFGDPIICDSRKKLTADLESAVSEMYRPMGECASR
jgi:1-acyl-sn-glycerol-3-phosphate acyltransferase